MSDHPPDDDRDRDEAGDSHREGDRHGDSDRDADRGAPSLDDPFAGDAPSDGADVGSGSNSDDPDDPDARDRGDAPLGDLAKSVGERRRRRESEPDPFETVEVDDVDEADLWASLGDEGAAGPEPAPGGTASVSSAGAPDGRPEHLVDKRKYCQRCPYLSAPPTTACEHEGTDIVEAVDADRFRVRGCPMVTDDGSPDFSAAEESAAGVGADPPGGETTARGVDVGGAGGAATDPDVLDDPSDPGDDA